MYFNLPLKKRKNVKSVKEGQNTIELYKLYFNPLRKKRKRRLKYN